MEDEEKLKKERLEYLKQTHNAVRSEIQMRITQRDTFAIQFIVSIGAILTLSFLDFKYAVFLFLLLPLVTIFYSVQILYSYTIHDRCHKFLCEKVEKEMAKLLGYDEYETNRFMWESYCETEAKERAIKTPGIRKGFFEKISLVMPFISSSLFYWVAMGRQSISKTAILIIALAALVVFTVLNIYIVCSFNLKANRKMMNNLSKVDYIDKEIAKDKRRKRVIFLDRDGTIHEDKENTHKISDLKYFSDTFSALQKLQKAGFEFVIVSNQDGIRKKLYDVETMHKFNQKIIEDFKQKGIKIAAVYYSPYDKIDNNYSFKPNPGMLLRAKYELNISMENSYFIGDQITDMIAGYRADVKPILVTTGIYKVPYVDNPYYKSLNPTTCSCLDECAEAILKDL